MNARILQANEGPPSQNLPYADVPIIDIGPWMNGIDSYKSNAAREDAVKAFRDASCRLGFMNIRGHGIPPDIISDYSKKCSQFFDLSQEAKDIIKVSADGFGYKALREENPNAVMGRPGPPDLRECLSFGPNVPEFAPNLYPPESVVPGFQAAAETYYKSIEDVALAVLPLLEAALEQEFKTPLPENWLKKAVGRHRGLILCQYYPKLEAESGQLRCAAHTDWPLFTLVCVESEGLEVIQDAQWRMVPLVENCLVLNLADLMECWTNGRFKSSLHRVNVNRSLESDRLTFSFFFPAVPDGTDDTVIAPLVDHDDKPHYQPTSLKQFIQHRFTLL